MKRYLITFLILLLAGNLYAADEWAKAAPAGTNNAADIDDLVGVNNEALDRMLSTYRIGAKMKYNSTSVITIEAGSVMCSITDGSLRKMRTNPSSGTLSVAASGNVTSYLYAVCDADAGTFTYEASTNSSTPTGTYYKRLGSFVKAGGSVTTITNDNESMIVATGTVANGGTISLPSGYAQSECDWTASVGSLSRSAGGCGINTITGTVNSSRSVTCTANCTNWVDGTINYAVTGTCNYIIACYR